MKDMAKTVHQGLVCESFELPGAKMKLNLKYRANIQKLELWTAGMIFLKLRG